MNQFVYNMTMNIKDLNFAMDTMYRRTNYLRKFAKRNSKKILLATAGAIYLFYNHQKKIEELEYRINILETDIYNLSKHDDVNEE